MVLGLRTQEGGTPPNHPWVHPVSLTILSLGSGAVVCWSQGWQSGGHGPLVSCPCVQEMSSEYREYADSFGKVSTAWLQRPLWKYS